MTARTAAVLQEIVRTTGGTISTFGFKIAKLMLCGGNHPNGIDAA
jgi:hypothetical protein